MTCRWPHWMSVNVGNLYFTFDGDLLDVLEDDFHPDIVDATAGDLDISEDVELALLIGIALKQLYANVEGRKHLP